MSYTTEDFKNITSSILSLGALILGVLSYLQARKSLFAPKTTEVFKLQLIEYRRGLEFLNKESFRLEFRHIIVYNLRLLAMDYQIAVGQINVEKRQEVTNTSLGLTVTDEMAQEIKWHGVGVPSIDDWDEHHLGSIQHKSSKLCEVLYLLEQVESSLFINKTIKHAFHDISNEYNKCITKLYKLLHDYKDKIKETISVKENDPIRSYWVTEIDNSFINSSEYIKFNNSLKAAEKLIEDEIKIENIMR